LTSMKAHQFAVNADPVVGELTLDLVFGGQVSVLIEPEAVAEEIGDQQPGVAFVGVAGHQVSQRLAVAADGGLEAVAGLDLPLGCPAGLWLLGSITHGA